MVQGGETNRGGPVGRLLALGAALLTGRTGAWLFTLALAVGAAVIFVLFLVPEPAYEPEDQLPWPFFAVAFAVAEIAIVHLMVRSQAVTVSLSEVPLVVGLYFLAPAYLVLAQFVGSSVALIVHRRQTPLKLAFNLSIFALSSSLAILVFRAIAPLASSSLIVWWLASFLGTATVVVVSAAAITVVISVSERRAALGAFGLGLGFGIAIAFVNTSIALVAVIFLRTEPDALWLLAAPTAIGLLGYRAYSAQRVREARLTFLYDCSQMLQGPLLDEQAMQRLLIRTCDMFRAGTVELTLAAAGSGQATRAVIGSGSPTRTEAVAAGEFDERRAMLSIDGGGRLVSLDSRSPLAPRRDDHGNAMIVPLSGAEGVVGTLMVADRLDDIYAFDTEDLRVLETLGSRLGLLVENSRLIERLGASFADVTQLASIVQSSQDGIIALDADGKITSWNPGAVRLFGYEAEEMLGRTASEVLPEPDRAPFRGSLADVLTGAAVGNVRIEWARKDGVRMPVSITISPIRGARDEITGASAIVRDETERHRAEQAAVASAEQLRAVIDGSPIGMGIAGADHVWIQVNPALSAMFGLTEDETLGRPVSAMIHPDDGATVRRLEERLFDREPAVRSLDRRYVKRDGTIVWTNVTARLVHLPSESGAPSDRSVALYAIKDITDRRQAEEQAHSAEERFRHAALTISAVKDPSKVLRAVIESARETLRAEYAAIVTHADGGSEVLSMEVDCVDPGRLERLGPWPTLRGVLGLASTLGRPVRLRNLQEHPAFGGFPNGHPEMTSFMGIPISVNGQSRATLYLANKLGAEEFSESDETIAIALATHAGVGLENARVNARARDLVRDLDRANLELVKASEAKSRFLATVAHELRTPLHAIVVAGELVHDPPAGPLTDDQIRGLGATIESSGRHMVRLIDDLVDLSRIEAGRLDLRSTQINLREVLAEVKLTLAPTAAARSVSLELPEDGNVDLFVDPVRLRQILTNLIANALKFTDRGGRVWMDVKATRATIRIAVHDTGIGIAREDIERAFLPFEQVSKTSTLGAGLGLAISRSIAELHGGTLRASSVPGTGSTFTLTLPRRGVGRPPALGTLPSNLSVASIGGGRPVLVVEDDPTAMNLATDVLRLGGFDVWQATGVQEATARLERGTPALILLDLRLGDGSGLDVATRVRAHPAWAAIPILVLSAEAMPDDVRRARSAGATDFLAKPISPRVMLARIHELIGEAAELA